MTARARDFTAEAEAHQHVVTARALIEQAAGLALTDTNDRPVVKIVAYRPSDKAPIGEGP